MGADGALTRWLWALVGAGLVALVAAFVPSPLRVFDLFDAPFRTPAIIFDFAKKMAIVLYHSGAARLVMIKLDKSAVAEFVLPFRNFLRQDVRVDINFQHCEVGFLSSRFSVRCLCPYLRAGFGIRVGTTCVSGWFLRCLW